MKEEISLGNQEFMRTTKCAHKINEIEQYDHSIS